MEYSYQTSNPADVISILLVGLVIYAVLAFLLGKVFAKAGIESWKAWVPVVNNWTFLQLGGFPGWFVFLGLVPLFGSLIALVLDIIAAVRIGAAFGKSGVFALWYVFITPVWYAILGFGKATYTPPAITPVGYAQPHRQNQQVQDPQQQQQPIPSAWSTQEPPQQPFNPQS